MTLDISITTARTLQEFRHIFDRNVEVKIDPFWGTDSVTIEGYEGAVSTDLIASAIFNITNFDASQDAEAYSLAELLANKVFLPLRDEVVRLDANCSATIYKIRNIGRIAYTPEDFKITMGYPCLKHSMPLLWLKKDL